MKTVDTKLSPGGYNHVKKGVDNDRIGKSHNYRMLIVGILIIVFNQGDSLNSVLHKCISLTDSFNYTLTTHLSTIDCAHNKYRPTHFRVLG